MIFIYVYVKSLIIYGRIMIKYLRKICFTLLLMVCHNLFAENGLLFNVSATGTPANINLTLCLNGKRAFSCQNYNVSALTLSIITTIRNHHYPFAGIKINTPGYTLANLGLDCAPSSSEYCLFAVSDTTPKNLVIVTTGPLAINPPSLPPATLNTAYSQTLTASEGVPPYTYAVTSGSLPTGLSLDSTTGVISGTPTTDSTYNFTITGTDSRTPTADTGSQAYSIVVTGPLPLSPTSLPGATLNTAYSQAVTANEGVPPYTYAVTSGSLPSGLSLNSSTGVISGTPTTESTYNFTITATDSQTPTADTGSQAYSIVVTGLLTISPDSLPSARVGRRYNQTVTASGGVAPYSYTITSGSLPAGLSLNGATGVISGRPSSVIGSSFTITATDSQTPTANTGSMPYTITIS